MRLRTVLSAVGLIVVLARRRRTARAPEPREKDASVLSALVDRLAISRSHANVALVTATVGVIVLAVSLHFARGVLTVHDPPIGSRGIAFRGPADNVVRRGIVVVSHIEVTACDEPVIVTVTVEGTAEYWRAHARQIGPLGRFTLIVDDLTITDIGAGIGALGDNLNPDLLPLPPHDAGSRLKASAMQVRRLRGATRITGHVRHWSRTWDPVYVRFRADWLSARAHGSCYLALPALVGSASSSSVRGNGTLLAYNSLTFYGGSVDLAHSRPQPAVQSGTSVAWRCEEKLPLPRAPTPAAYRRREIVPGLVFARGGRAAAFTERAFRRGTFRSEGCTGLTTLVESGAETVRDLRVLLLGAAIGLALALFAQGAIAALQARFDIQRDVRALRRAARLDEPGDATAADDP